MSNHDLLRSSAILGLIHVALIAFFTVPVPFALMIFTGIVTSVWNHAVTNSYVKWIDRVFMIFAVLVDAYYIGKFNGKWRAILNTTLASAVILYFLHYPHLPAHIMVTLTHIGMIYVWNYLPTTI